MDSKQIENVRSVMVGMFCIPSSMISDAMVIAYRNRLQTMVNSESAKIKREVYLIPKINDLVLAKKKITSGILVKIGGVKERIADSVVNSAYSSQKRVLIGEMGSIDKVKEMFVEFGVGFELLVV